MSTGLSAVYTYQWHVSGVEDTSPRHHLGYLSTHVTREIGEVPLIADDIIHYHLQSTGKEAGH